MWIRKSPQELWRERGARKIKFEIFVFVLILMMCVGIFWRVGSIDNFLRICRMHPELGLNLLFLLLFVYLGYRNYVLHGSYWTERPGKICLVCEKGMGYSDDGWGFKVYGSRKTAWYQVKACATPEKCDIAYLFEVKLMARNQVAGQDADNASADNKGG